MVYRVRSPSLWVFGIYGCIEMLTLSRKDLLMLAMENIHNLIVELYALAVIHLMKNSIANLSLKPLLTDCKLLL